MEKRYSVLRTTLVGAGVWLAIAVFCGARTAVAGPYGQAAASERPAEQTPLEQTAITEAAPTLEPHPGEICLVCNEPIGASDRVYVIDGQRVPVHVGTCDTKLKEEPAQYLAKLKPRGAFLGAEPAVSSTPSWVWVILASYILLGLIFGALSAYRALNRGLRPLGWFFAGFFFNVLGFAILLARPAGEGVTSPAGIPAGLAKIPATYAPRACPACGKLNHPSAPSCSGCGAKLQPSVASEVAKAGLRSGAG